MTPKIKKEPVSSRGAKLPWRIEIKVEIKKEQETASVHEEVDRLFSNSENGDESSAPSDNEGDDRTTYVADDVLSQFVGKETQFRYQVALFRVVWRVDEKETMALYIWK